MDNTLLGALIGAGATLTAVIVSARINYKATQKQENKKLINQKKEAIYLTVEKIKIDAASRLEALEKIVNKESVNLELFQNGEPSHLANLNMLISLYFKELNESRNKMNDMFKELNRYLIRIYEPEAITYLGPDFSNGFLINAQLQYKEFIKHVDAIQKMMVNID